MSAITKAERIASLKTLGALANKYLSQYKELKDSSKKTWISLKSESAIKSLQDIIARINIDLHPKNIEAYCQPRPEISIPIGKWDDPAYADQRILYNKYWGEILRQVQPLFLQIDILRLSPEQNIEHDITWLNDGVVGDYMEIALGIKDVTTLAVHLPGSISDVKLMAIPFYETLPNFTHKTSLIRQAIDHSREKNYLTSNILLITVTESIVRELCYHVYQKQNPDKDASSVHNHVYNAFISMESLITKGGWKDDFPKEITSAVVTYFDVNEPTINLLRNKVNAHGKVYRKIVDNITQQREILDPAKERITEEQRLLMLDQVTEMEKLSNDWIGPDNVDIKINLSTMLNFLARKYKDDRNTLIHGNFEALNHEWKNYINYAALLEVTKVYQDYLQLYPIGHA